MCPTVFSKHKGLVVHYVELMRIFRTLGDSSFASLSLLLEASKLLSCCTQPCCSGDPRFVSDQGDDHKPLLPLSQPLKAT